MSRTPNSFKYVSELIVTLRNTKSEQHIINHIIDCFNTDFSVNDKDEILRLLLDVAPKRLATTKELKTYASEITGLPNWLILRSEDETRSFLNAFSLLLHGSSVDNPPTITHWISKISGNEAKEIIPDLIKEISYQDDEERLLLLQLITGTFKSPVSRTLIYKSLAQVLGISVETMGLRLYEHQLRFAHVKHPVDEEKHKIPSSFLKIRSIKNDALESLGNPLSWNAYGKKDGIIAQVVKLNHDAYLWSEEGEILNHWFPEVIEAVKHVGNRIKIKGQIVPENPIVSNDRLITRIQRKNINKKEIETFPATFEIWHVSENESEIDQISESANFRSLNEINFTNWGQLAKFRQSCRQQNFNGILLKYQEKKDEYLYLKANSYCIKALLINVEVGSMTNEGIQSLTFGVFNQKKQIIPIAKVDSFHDQLDISEILGFTRDNTLERFGPVRTIKPELIYELHFDSIKASKRRKSGISLENVRIFEKIRGSKAVVDKLENIKAINQ